MFPVKIFKYTCERCQPLAESRHYTHDQVTLTFFRFRVAAVFSTFYIPKDNGAWLLSLCLERVRLTV